MGLFCRKVFLLLSLLLSSTNYAQTYEILVSSRATSSVKWYDINGNYIGDFVTSGSGGLSNTEDILFHPDGRVLVSGFGNTTIKAYDGVSGQYLGDFSSGYTLDQPSKMSIGPDSLIYITQWGSAPNKVVRFDLSGNFVDEFTSIPLNNGLFHVWDDTGNFYIAVYGSGTDGTVHKFDSAGNDLGVFINSAVLQGPTTVWWYGNDMLVNDWTAGTILRYDSTGQYLGVFGAGMSSPEGIAFLPNGNFIIGDWGVDAVHEFDSTGANLGQLINTGGLQDPNSVRVRISPTLAVNELDKSSDHIEVRTGSNQITVIAHLKNSTSGDLNILDHQGRLIHTFEKVNWQTGVNEVSYALPAEVSSGMYILELTTDHLTLSQKFLISR